MKGKVDNKGTLWIERAGTMKEQACPFSNGETVRVNDMEAVTMNTCGDWCPHFGEPRMDIANGMTEPVSPHTMVNHCKNSWWSFDEFTDERTNE